MNLDRISGLWIGKSLSTLEKLSISSFIKNGHDYYLYVYDEVDNIPDGTIIQDANEIILEKDIFYSQQSPSEYLKNLYKKYSISEYSTEKTNYKVMPGSGFPDYFRFKVMNKYGGYWADTDMVCLRPLDFDDKYVLSSEKSDDGEIKSASGILKFPSDSEILSYAINYIEDIKDKENISWGLTGPLLMGIVIEKFNLHRYVKNYNVLMPLHWWEAHKFFIPNGFEVTDDMYSMHCWNEIWRHNGWDKDRKYSNNSLYEKLKKKFL